MMLSLPIVLIVLLLRVLTVTFIFWPALSIGWSGSCLNRGVVSKHGRGFTSVGIALIFLGLRPVNEKSCSCKSRSGGLITKEVVCRLHLCSLCLVIILRCCSWNRSVACRFTSLSPISLYMLLFGSFRTYCLVDQEVGLIILRVLRLWSSPLFSFFCRGESS